MEGKYQRISRNYNLNHILPQLKKNLPKKIACFTTLNTRNASIQPISREQDFVYRLVGGIFNIKFKFQKNYRPKLIYNVIHPQRKTNGSRTNKCQAKSEPKKRQEQLKFNSDTNLIGGYCYLLSIHLCEWKHLSATAFVETKAHT